MIKDLFKIGIYSVDLNLDVKAIKDYCLDYRKKDTTQDKSNRL